MAELRPFYDACTTILSTWNDVNNNMNLADPPNPYYGRTDGILLLETKTIAGGSYLRQLYTPFGKFKLRATGFFAEDELAASSEFLRKIQWSIIEVTTVVEVVFDEGPLKYSKCSDEELKLFLITAVGDRLKLANNKSLTFLHFKPDLSDEDLRFEDLTCNKAERSSNCVLS
jgi:hypothetical protein